MPEALVIEPDAAFVKDVIAHGGADLKKCYQCATCSTVCELSPDAAPFPRRQMIEAQWGLKEKLLGDPALWLCHNCGKCTEQCPRGARPGDVLGALRRASIARFAFPGFMATLAGSPRALPLLFLLPALLFFAIARWAPKDPPTARMEFANLFPIPVLEALFFAVAGLVLFAFAVSVARFVRRLEALGRGGSIVRGFIPALIEIGREERFKACDSKDWRLGHRLTLWGFIGLAIVGTAAGVGTMTGLLHTPLALASRLKILANVSAVFILAGSAVLLVHRVRDPIKRVGSTYFDWFFLLTLTGVVLSGIGSEALRLAQVAVWMYVVYFVHLVLIFALFLYAPYSKFAHLAYRTIAIAACGQWKSSGECRKRAEDMETKEYPVFN